MIYKNLNICINQMSVVPGRPDINARYIIKETQSAAERGVDIIIFPEMAVPGYFIGDKHENQSFVKEVSEWNKEICKASVGITVVFGSFEPHYPNQKNMGVKEFGEDGRRKLYNLAMIASNGRYLGFSVKTLQPNYRYFNDDKHMFSNRKVIAELGISLEEQLRTFKIMTKHGPVNLGVILCEDMWHQDYSLNPTQELVNKGAEMVINLSASPWGWQKNRKRHQVVKDLLSKCQVPFVYVNNTGSQNTGKNILVFDGSSTAYNALGDPVFEVPAYEDGSFDFSYQGLQSIVAKSTDDRKELFDALCCAIRAQLSVFPKDRQKVIVGLSGGIDSGVVAALFTHILGKENVFAVNMPSRFNSDETKSYAKTIADRLEISYEVYSIEGKMKALTSLIPEAVPGSVAYENAQSRARLDCLATLAQSKYNALFTCNGNKVEFAFGYCTMYGDNAGFLAPLADLVKREVRQLAEFINEQVFGREIIPQACIDQKPTAELNDNQRDPFDYGYPNRRGYHDEMVRAFVEFSRDPEWFVEQYLEGTLESTLLLEHGTLSSLFPNAEAFIKDLEKHWYVFHGSYFKRVQSPPIVVVSRRAFGRDFEEALMPAHFTLRYQELKQKALAKLKSVVIFGGAFNPPGLHHRHILEALTKQFDHVVVMPSGYRPDKSSSGMVSDADRQKMIELAFSSLDKVTFDWSDLGKKTFTRTFDLDKIYKAQFPNAQIYHAVGGDLVAGGGQGLAQIQTSWYNGPEVWQSFHFAVLNHPAAQVALGDLPPHHKVVPLDSFHGRSTLIRQAIAEGVDIDKFLSPEVVKYINARSLYKII